MNVEKTYLNLKYYIEIFVKLCLLLCLLENWAYPMIGNEFEHN
jgi:hypothetical protein